jgi:hypothetical protein
LQRTLFAYLPILTVQGLLVALQNASPKSLIVVFTDNGSKDLELEREIVRQVSQKFKILYKRILWD